MKGNLRMLKYPLFNTQEAVFDDTITIVMSAVPGVAHVAMQNGIVTLWCIHDSDLPSVPVRFHIAGTGHVLPDGSLYVDTVFDRQFVWHIFELPA